MRHFITNSPTGASMVEPSRERIIPTSYMRPQAVGRPKEVSAARILVVDDDPIFGRVMQRLAKQNGLNVTVCTGAKEVGALKDWNFDVGVLDYDLGRFGTVTGVELASYLQEYIEHLAIVLVSQSEHIAAQRWPDSIQCFVPKGNGPFAVLDAVMRQLSSRR